MLELWLTIIRKFFSPKLTYEERLQADPVSYRMDGFEMVLYPFDPSKWRQSFFIFGNVISWHTGEFLGTDLFHGLSYDFLYEDAIRADWWPDLSYWVESPELAVHIPLLPSSSKKNRKKSKLVSQNTLNSKKEKHWLCGPSQSFFIFSSKLPQSLLIKKKGLPLLNWESFSWNHENLRNLVSSKFAKKDLNF